MDMKTVVLCFVALGLAASGSLARAQTIVNIAATDSAAAETWPGQAPNPGNVRITRTGSTLNELRVWVKVSGTATRNSDYSFGITVGAFVTIPPTSSQLDIPINVLDDTLTEPVETVRIDLDDQTSSGSPVPYSIGDHKRAEVSIADNDDPSLPPRAVVSVAALQDAAEGTNGAPVAGAFRITRTANLDVEVTVAYAMGGSALPGVDYEELTGTVTISRGAEFADVTVTPVDDDVLEGPESVTLTLLPSSCPGAFPPPPECYIVHLAASASLVILDNEIPPPPPTVALNMRQDTNVFGFPAQMNGSLVAVAPTGHISSYEIRVDELLQFSGNVDYQQAPLPGTPFEFNFTATNLSGGPHVVQATVTDDHGLRTTTNRTLFIVAIQPPPPPPARYSIVALDAEAAETAPGEAPRPGRFLFTRTGTPGDLEFFSYSFTGSAREGVDYNISYGPAIFTTNDVTNVLSQEITINPIDDFLIEGTETVKMQLCFPIIVIIYGVGAPIGVSCTGDVPGLNATISILDNDTADIPVLSVTATDSQAYEENVASRTASFLVKRTGSVAESLTVPYQLSGDASNGVDYVELAGYVTIAAGESSAVIVIDPIADGVAEPVETVGLTLQAAPPDVFPPPYLLSDSPTLPHAAGVSIRDRLVRPDNPFRGHGIEWLQHCGHAIVPLPAPLAVVNAIPTSWTVEASSDLATWQEIGIAEDPEEFVDVNAGHASVRFYRFRQLSPALGGP